MLIVFLLFIEEKSQISSVKVSEKETLEILIFLRVILKGKEHWR